MTNFASRRTLARTNMAAGRVMTTTEDIFRRALAAAYDLHRHRDAATYPARLVRVLAQLVPCDSALLVTVEPAGGDFHLESWPAATFERLDRGEVARLHAAEHPFVAHCRVSRSARASRLGDLAPREEFLRSGLYSNLYRFLGIEHQLLMLVAGPDARWRALVLNRRSPEFSEEERAAFESLWPHITLAQRNLRRGLRSKMPVVSDTAPGETSGVIVIRSSGAVTLCTERARVWLAEYFDAVFVARGVTLPAPLLQWAQKRIEDEGGGKGLRVVRRDAFTLSRGGHCLVADLIVDHGKDLHLMRLEKVALNAPAASLEALGLTPREAEVLSWVAQGKTNREVGMILGSSARTVQKHLEHVFEKIGVESRTAAILKAWQAGRERAPA
ncbi:MAG: response regulator transcription factor [Usitatibacter sp.]